MVKTTKISKKDKAQKDQEATFSPGQIKKFFGEVQVEFTKIVWPDKKVTFGLTGIVIVFAILASAYLGSVDLLLGKLLSSFLR